MDFHFRRKLKELGDVGRFVYADRASYVQEAWERRLGAKEGKLKSLGVVEGVVDSGRGGYV